MKAKTRDNSYRWAALAIPLVAILSCGDPVIDGDHLDILAIDSVEPLSGHSAGGTTVTLRIHAGCDEPTVRFGDDAAVAVRVVGDGVVTAKTPPHPIGDTNVVVACGSVESLPFATPFRFSAREIVFADRFELPPAAGDTRAADFDGDGLDDLAVVEPDALRVAVYLATGFDGFDTVAAFDLAIDEGFDARRAVVGVTDISGDGQADLTVSIVAPDDRYVRTVTKVSDDGYEVPRLRDVDATTTSIVGVMAAIDIDGDGVVDPILAEATGDDNIASVALFASRSQERLVLAERVIASALPQLVLGDFDRDGHQDLMLVVLLQPFFGLHVLGGEQPTITTFDVDELFTNAVYFDEDGWPDLIVDRDVVDAFGVRRGMGPGVFGAFETLEPPCDRCERPRDVSGVLTDLDGNGVPDQIIRTFDSLYFVEYASGRAQLLPGSALVDFATTAAGRRPLVLMSSGEGLSAVRVGHALLGEPASGVHFDTNPTLLDTTAWSCFGDFEGRRIAVGPSDASADRLLVRIAEVGLPFAPPRSVPMPSALSRDFVLCLPARLGPQLDGFVVYRDTDDVVAITIAPDGTLATFSVPPAGAVAVARSISRPRHANSAGVGRVLGSGALRTLERLEIVNGASTVVERATFDAEGAALPTLLDEDDLVDVLLDADRLPVLFGRRAVDGALELERRELAPDLVGVDHVAPADIDGDGDWDLVVTTTTELVVFENRGGGELVEIERTGRDGVDYVFAACDFDADRHNDLFVTSDDVAGIRRRAEPGSPYLPLALWEQDGFSVATAFLDTCTDIDADGLPDIVHAAIRAGVTQVFYNRSH